MSLLAAPQSCRVVETTMLDVVDRALFRWAIPEHTNKAHFSLVIRNLSETTNAEFYFQEGSGTPSDNLTAVIGIPQTGGLIPLVHSITNLYRPTGATGTVTLDTTNGLSPGQSVTIANATGATGFNGSNTIVEVLGATGVTVTGSGAGSTAWVTSTGVTGTLARLVANSQDSIVIGYVHGTLNENTFEESFSTISDTGVTLPPYAQKTLYFSTTKRFIQMCASVVPSNPALAARIQIVGASTANVVNYQKRNCRGAI